MRTFLGDRDNRETVTNAYGARALALLRLTIGRLAAGAALRRLFAVARVLRREVRVEAMMLWPSFLDDAAEAATREV